VTVTREQAIGALARATAVKTQRRALQREIHSLGPHDGRRRVAEVLRDPSDYMEDLAVGELLSWPKWGANLVSRWCGDAGVNQLFRIAGPYQRRRGGSALPSLTAAQRERLAVIVSPDEERVP
jgi:hypothetical protein